MAKTTKAAQKAPAKPVTKPQASAATETAAPAKVKTAPAESFNDPFTSKETKAKIRNVALKYSRAYKLVNELDIAGKDVFLAAIQKGAFAAKKKVYSTITDAAADTVEDFG